MKPQSNCRVPAASECVLPYLIARAAKERPEDIFATFEDAESWTFQQTADRARRVGAGLRRAGVTRGERVLVWLPNGPRSLSAWFGINMLGAVFVGINLAYRGALLQHVIENTDAKTIICHPDLAPLLASCGSNLPLKTVFTDIERVNDLNVLRERGLIVRPVSDLEQEAADDLPVEGIQPWDLQSICFTSGTTGPSKGVLSSYLHLYTMGVECTAGTDRQDRWLINLPLFHVGGTLFVMGALAHGSSIGMLNQFRTETFFATCRGLGVTAACLLGAMATFLLRQDPKPDDRLHGLRRVMVVPLSEDARLLNDRFGFTVYTVFNMSEISCPIRSEDNPVHPGSCGKVRDGVEARIVDENDCEVPVGQAGELTLRTGMPWTMSQGYHKMPEATASAWRNGWFHTGDMFRQDEDGNYFFVDRIKDAIRRRGENISSFEVESELLSYPGILEAAVIGVASEHGEQDVLATLALKPDAAISNAELVAFLCDRLPHFMVPRYFRFVPALPKTPTGKVEKHVLRAAGVTSDTWDRDAQGIRVTRQKLT
ncbi:Long-chain-fatty-acid--CoA ligase [compost metagenome]